MAVYRLEVRRTTTEIGYVYVEAADEETARRELEENALQGFVGRFDVEELVEEQHDLTDTPAQVLDREES
jgi:hypothetical protein